MLQICGFENVSCWMYEEPSLVHDLISLITEAFINWVKVQKEYTGEPMDASNGLQGIWSPKGVGV
jgi:uroporphyrinogen-III decarboxylase